MPIHSAFLRYFDQVCRSGSIRLAAQQLYVASSAVNRQVLKIEDELGVRLFERHRGGMQLTDAGRLLQQHVARTLEDHERTLNEIRLQEERKRPTITLVAQESVIAHFLPPALVALHTELPEVSTVFRAASGTKLQSQLLAGRADIALAFDAPESDGIEVFASCHMPVGAVVGTGHPLAAQRRASLAECARYPVVLPDPTWPLRALLDREVARCRLELNVITSSNSVELIKKMIGEHSAIGFQALVGIERELEAGELCHVPLFNPQPMTQCFSLIVRKDRAEQPVVRRVLELIGQRLDAYRS